MLRERRRAINIRNSFFTGDSERFHSLSAGAMIECDAGQTWHASRRCDAAWERRCSGSRPCPSTADPSVRRTQRTARNGEFEPFLGIALERLDSSDSVAGKIVAIGLDMAQDGRSDQCPDGLGAPPNGRDERAAPTDIAKAVSNRMWSTMWLASGGRCPGVEGSSWTLSANHLAYVLAQPGEAPAKYGSHHV
jgi:hypothetical protein